jgi:hypothetical protein
VSRVGNGGQSWWEWKPDPRWERDTGLRPPEVRPPQVLKGRERSGGAGAAGSCLGLLCSGCSLGSRWAWQRVRQGQEDTHMYRLQGEGQPGQSSHRGGW